MSPTDKSQTAALELRLLQLEQHISELQALRLHIKERNRHETRHGNLSKQLAPIAG